MMFMTRLKIAAAVIAALGLAMAGAAVFATKAADYRIAEAICRRFGRRPGHPSRATMRPRERA